jgi:hypothetical protein
MPNLESSVERLSYDELVEAANFYLPDAVGTADLEKVEKELAGLIERLGGSYANLEKFLEDIEEDEASIEYLLRLILLKAASGNEKSKRGLAEALDGVGKSQVVIEVIYAIFAATTLGLAWLVIPPQEEETTTTRETRRDGTQIETTKTSRKDTPPPIEKLFGWIGGLSGRSPGKDKGDHGQV